MCLTTRMNHLLQATNIVILRVGLSTLSTDTLVSDSGSVVPRVTDGNGISMAYPACCIVSLNWLMQSATRDGSSLWKERRMFILLSPLVSLLLVFQEVLPVGDLSSRLTSKMQRFALSRIGMNLEGRWQIRLLETWRK